MPYLSKQVVCDLVIAGLVVAAVAVVLGLSGCGDANAGKRAKAVTMDDLMDRLEAVERKLDAKLADERKNVQAVESFGACQESCDKNYPYPKLPSYLDDCDGDTCIEVRASYMRSPVYKRGQENFEACRKSCGKAPFGFQWEC